MVLDRVMFFLNVEVISIGRFVYLWLVVNKGEKNIWFFCNILKLYISFRFKYFEEV